MNVLDTLIEIVNDISKGNYSNSIMQLTGPDIPHDIGRIAEAIGLMMVKIEAREYQLSMMVKELETLNEKIRKNTLSTLSTMAKALATRDIYTEGHTERVSRYAKDIACHMGLEEKEQEDIRIGGLLHDIGKIGFPDLLFQPHKEKNPNDLVKEIKAHPIKGFDILKDLDFIGTALDYVLCHHERPDGKGYPRGLKGSEIPLGARIISVADGYDAMTTVRPYQEPKSSEEAMDILNKLSDKKWDRKCVHALIEVINSRKSLAV